MCLFVGRSRSGRACGKPMNRGGVKGVGREGHDLDSLNVDTCLECGMEFDV